MSLTVRVTGGTSTSSYYRRRIIIITNGGVAADRLGGRRALLNTTLLSRVVAGRASPDTAFNRSRCCPPNSPQQHQQHQLLQLAEGWRHYKNSIGAGFCHERRFHTSPSTRLQATMSRSSSITTTTAAEKAGGENGAAVDLHKSPAASSWIGNKGAAAFDLRSDTMTTPTAAMLSAIQTATLLDDVFEEDPTTQALEAHVADLTGKEAGLLVLSGTMGNQVALRTLLTQPPHGVLCDYRSHIVKYEAGGVSSLTGATTQPIQPTTNGLYLTLEDIQAHAILDDNVHYCPTRVISLENSLDGLIMPLSEIERIGAFARAHNIKLHCDGARLWEVVAASSSSSSSSSASPNGPSLRDYAANFDTLTLCFSKGLGAPIGSVLVGRAATIQHARRIRKMLGGGLRQSGVVAAAARVAVDATFGAGPRGEGGLLRATHEMARRVEALWAGVAGGSMEVPVQTNMCWLDLGSAGGGRGVTAGRLEALGAEAGLKLMGNRIVTHYQVGEEALRRLEGVFQRVAEEATAAAGGSEGEGEEKEKGAKGSSPYGVKSQL